MVQGLLVCTNAQYIIVPYSQVQRIDYGADKQYNAFYTLNELLNQPDASAAQVTQEATRPVLILYPDTMQLAVQVDAVLGEVEMVTRPLSNHLRRPGITDAAIDGMGNVVFVVHLHELIRHFNEHAQQRPNNELLRERKQPYLAHSKQATSPQRILIADDSLSIRQSLRSILEHMGYMVTEAHDGLEALEQVLEQSPNVLLLDIEMPNLNGYDLLSIIQANPQFAGLKIVMLTSRSSQKHQQRAFDMGAHAYLIKPCPQDTLLETLRSLECV
jgi:chemosensory pili system protein ChpA (sensor histidine kinase/response regulator)